MKFACLGYLNETNWNALSESAREAAMEECLSYDDELVRKGHWLNEGQSLQSARTAKTLRLSDKKLVITDGPYAETKEQLGGLGILEAKGMDHAVELISKHPGLKLGPFEIRPLDEKVEERCASSGVEVQEAGEGMQIACLGYGNEDHWPALSEGDRDALISECIAYDKVLREYGRHRGGNALQPVKSAKTLRYQGRKVIVTDGPFAETKEQLGGVATYEFKDMKAAIDAWSGHPCLRVGDVLELRPVDETFNARWEERQKRKEDAVAQ